MQSKKELEEGTKLMVDFTKIARIAEQCPDVIPVVVQDADSDEVILLAYTNRLAFNLALRTKTAVFWSTSRNELWEKGKTSGNVFRLVEARINCEQNSLLYRVRARRGGICHTSNRKKAPRNCYYRKIDPESRRLENLDP
jgi:phosphoribosyl-AMP cyclohydrolase